MAQHVTVVGSLNYDILFKQKRMPVRGETVTADSVAVYGGGKGANQSVQCAKLGVHTYHVGKVGQDEFGDFLLAELEKFGVDTTFVKRSKLNTGLAAVNTMEDGSIFSTISTGANFDVTVDDIDSTGDVFTTSDMVVLQLECPIPVVEYCVRKAKEHDVYCLLNAAPAKPVSPETLRVVDCLMVNEVEAGFYTGAPITDLASAQQHYQKLLDMTDGIVVITLGPAGSLLCRQDGSIQHFPANTDTKVLDTIGAGDSYVGGFVHQNLQGASDEEACTFATVVANITVTAIGAQPAMPTLADIKSP